MARMRTLTGLLLVGALGAGLAAPMAEAGPFSKKKQDDKAAAPAAEAAKPAAAPVAAARLIDYPHVERELPNGLRVIVVKTPAKGMVSLQIPMQTGSRNEIETGKTGFAHFFEHMMFRGTPDNPPEKYQAAMKAAGADQNASTSDDVTIYHVNFTKADLETVLALESDRFQHLSYTDEQFRTEALAVKGEYLKNFSNPLRKGFESLGNLAYTTHTYKHSTMGFVADIDAMPNQIDYAKTFFNRWYRPEYATVILVGDIELEEGANAVQKYFGSWQRGDYKVTVPTEPPQTEAHYQHLEWKGPTLPWIIAGWHAPAFSTTRNDAAALDLLAEIYFGESSALYQKLVIKERLVDRLSAEAPGNVDPGLFTVIAELTKPENAAAVTAAINETLRAARTTRLSAETISRTRSRFKYSFARGLQSPATIGAILARFAHYERHFDTLNDYFARMDQVGGDDVLAVANAVFTDGNRNVVSIAQAPKLDGADGFAALDGAVKSAAVVDEKAPEPLVYERDDGSVEAFSTGANGRKNPFAAKDAARNREATEAWTADEARYTVKVMEKKNDSPLVDVVITFRVGAAIDPPGKKGLTQLTASMLAEGGSEFRDIETLQALYYPLATDVNVTVDKEMVKFAATVHRDNLEKWWQAFGEQLITPGFRQDDLDRLKLRQVNAIRVGLRSNNDEELGKEALYQMVYGPDHAYGTLNLGRAKDVEKINLEDVRTFYREHFGRGRMIVSVAGNYDDKVLRSILSSTMRLKQDDYNKIDAKAPAVAAGRSALVIQKETPAVAVSFGIPLDVKRGDADWAALWLARSWLGEHRSSAGRLYSTIREDRGMNYGDYAYIEYFPAGMFRMQPGTGYVRQNDLFQIWLRPLRTNNDAVFATRAALREIDALAKKGMSREDFEASRAFLKKFAVVLTAAQRDELGYAIDSELNGTRDFVAYVTKALDELTLEKVNDALKRRIKPEGFQFVYVTADAAGLARQLSEGKPSPITYNTPKPALAADDKVIASYPLGLKAANVKVVKAESLFE